MRIAEYWVRPMQSLIEGGPSARGAQLVARLAQVRADYTERYPTREPQESTPRRRLLEFAERIEHEIAEVVRRHSLLYWLHAVRCFRPRIPAVDPIVVFQIRMCVESAIQKYAQTALCGRVGWSDEVPPERILRGLFAATADADAIEALSRTRMPVLTDFGRDELDELDFLHQACEHLQRCMIVLRTMVWSGRLVVNELSAFDLAIKPDLLQIGGDTPIALGPYRKRGVASNPDQSHSGGVVLLPNYTVVPKRPDSSVLRRYAAVPDEDGLGFAKAPLYCWHPVSLSEVYHAHRPSEDEFRHRNACELSAVLLVIACLSARATSQWHDAEKLVADWHQAMDPAVSPARLVEDLLQRRSHVAEQMFQGIEVSDEAVRAAVGYLTLTDARRGGIDPLFGVPLLPLLPSGSDLLVDYAWLLRLVDGLFFRVRIGQERFWS